MVTFPNVKINLGLNILKKRADGFHDIESCFYPVNWCDALEIIPSSKLTFRSFGIDIPGNPEENLCLKAYHLLKKDFDIPPVEIILLKNVPIGAGLGGGSSDASFTLKTLNEIFSLSLSNEQLRRYASQLGSDCPFFINNQPVIASGTGTTFSDSSIQLSGKHITIIYPNIHVSTKEAYANVQPNDQTIPIEKLISAPIEAWRNELKNDFELSLFPKYPQLQELKDLLYDKGARYASMTGSGSAVYGIFYTADDIPNLPQYTQWSGDLA